MITEVPKDKLIEELAKSIGIEAAVEIVNDTMRKLGIDKDVLSKDEAIKVCRALAERGDVVGISARVIIAKIYIGSL